MALGQVPVYSRVLKMLPLTGNAVFLVMFSTAGVAVILNVVLHVGVPVTMKLRS